MSSLKTLNKQYYGGWYKDHADKIIENCNQVRQILDQYNIPFTDKILAVDDPSINIWLYLIKQQGYTAFSFRQIKNEDKTGFLIDRGLKYIVIDHSLPKNDSSFVTHLGNEIGRYNDVAVYEVQ